MTGPPSRTGASPKAICTVSGKSSALMAWRREIGLNTGLELLVGEDAAVPGTAAGPSFDSSKVQRLFFEVDDPSVLPVTTACSSFGC